MIHITLENQDVRGHAAAFSRLLNQGCRSYLLCGLSPAAAEEFLAATTRERAAKKLELASTDVETSEIRCVRSDEAFGVERQWDAVILFGTDEKQKQGLFANVFRLGNLPSLVYSGRRAEKVIVESIRKSGTHLIAELMRGLGYRVIGPHIADNDPENCLALERLGKEGVNTCMLTHGLDLFEPRNRPYLVNWVETSKPAIIFNYRDPRDATCSLVHYLMGETIEPFSPLFMHFLRSEILRALPSHEARLTRATLDPCFSLLGYYQADTWLLGHPGVCEVSFERLVGTAGGGSESLQLRETARAMAHLGVAGDVAQIAARIFNPNVRVFFRGQIGAWRKEFTTKNLRDLNRTFGSILELYGYDTE